MQARKQRLCIKNATSAHAPQAAIFKSITGTSAALRCLQPSVSTSALEDNLGVTLQTNKFVTHCSFFVPLNRIVFVFSLFECKTLTSLIPVPAALITGPNGNPALEDENTHLEEKNSVWSSGCRRGEGSYTQSCWGCIFRNCWLFIHISTKTQFDPEKMASDEPPCSLSADIYFC